MDYANGGVPKTVAELKDYCEKNGFTPSKTRFFIDNDYKGPKAFGIYKDESTGEFVVYKNKADGTRAVRYRGTDEEFAVVELYDRLQSEIQNQQIRYAADMAERERNMYNGGDDHALDSIKKFNINDYPVSNNPFDSFAYEDDSRSSHRGGKQSDPLGVLIGIIVMILSLLFGGIGGFGGGSRSSSYYDSGYSSSWDYDSGWSSDSWDSGYTDWDSDW